MSELLKLSSVSAADIEKLLDDAFGADRRQRTAYLLRRGVAAIDHLSFAIVDGQTLVGSIQCWPVEVNAVPLILVGPVAVSPNRQNQGLGHQLMNATLSRASEELPMVMIGDPEYYGRFAFIADRTGEWTLPGPWEAHRLLLRNLRALPLPEIGIIGPRT